MKEKIIGIDLGTSNSSAAVMEGDKPVIIPSAEGTTIVGGKAFPSYVAFTKDGQVLVGEPARRQAAQQLILKELFLQQKGKWEQIINITSMEKHTPHSKFLHLYCKK